MVFQRFRTSFREQDVDPERKGATRAMLFKCMNEVQAKLDRYTSVDRTGFDPVARTADFSWNTHSALLRLATQSRGQGGCKCASIAVC